MEKRPSPADQEDSRRGMAGPRAIGEFALKLTGRPFGKRGFAAASLIAAWPAVIGSALGASTLPLRITFPRGKRSDGTLHLKVASGALALELQHQERLLLERINAHFGYGAVSRVALVQGPIPIRKRRVPPAPAPLSPERERTLQARLSAIPDEGLREALNRLGRHLAGKS